MPVKLTKREQAAALRAAEKTANGEKTEWFGELYSACEALEHADHKDEIRRANWKIIVWKFQEFFGPPTRTFRGYWLDEYTDENQDIRTMALLFFLEVNS